MTNDSSWTDDFDAPEAVLVQRASVLAALRTIPMPAMQVLAQDYDADTGEKIGEPYEVTVEPFTVITGRLL